MDLNLLSVTIISIANLGELLNTIRPEKNNFFCFAIYRWWNETNKKELMLHQDGVHVTNTLTLHWGPSPDGLLPEKLGGGVLPASQNPYPIYDQNLRYSLPYLWPDQKFETLFMTLKSKPCFRPTL